MGEKFVGRGGSARGATDRVSFAVQIGHVQKISHIQIGHVQIGHICRSTRWGNMQRAYGVAVGHSVWGQLALTRSREVKEALHERERRGVP
jgi:hypothetical protein